MPKRLLFFVACFTLYISSVIGQANHINVLGATLLQRVFVPSDFARIQVTQGSFGAYLRNIKLKRHGTLVHYYDGTAKKVDRVYCAVIDQPIGKTDLQQCADVIMHARAEYLWSTQQEDKIHFTFTNGFKVDYSKWKAGYRIAVKGNKTNWVKSAAPDNSYATYCNYMDIVYNYCGTLSLSKELKKVDFSDIQPADILIKRGTPGHAELVMDVAVNANGKKIFLLSQSYMPSQEMQLLINPKNENFTPWYEAYLNDENIYTPEWDFKKSQLMRFADN